MQGDFLIKDWLVQPQTNTVERGSRRWHLEPKVMQVLVQLALHSDQVLSKERLIETVWRGTFVGDDVLIRCISEIRYVFGDDARSPSIIQTIPKSGYRLIAPVTMQVDAPSSAAIASAMRERESSRETEPTPVAVSAASVLEEQPSPVEETQRVPPATELPVLAEALPPVQRPPLQFSHRTKLVAAIALVLAMAASGGYSLWRHFHQSPFTTFWKPILDTPEPVLFCIADQNQYSFITLRDANELTRQVVLNDNLSAVVIDDLDTIVQVAASLRAHGKNYLLRGEEKTSLSDLRNGPAIFVGAFDNAWTLRLTKQLRYHFANNADMTQFHIVDTENPSATEWTINRTQQLATNNYKDYALVARFVDANTGKLAIIIAGIGRGGTVSGGEFLTNPDHLRELVKAIRANGNKPNFEIVLSTQIIDGHAGAPKMEAAHFW